mmetsp:Transcript_22928/g.54131  ORF Transcript_22928/g.54131 Transcript_22928/m.54131 type:complete len:201 (+) Transcript_22928:584-1186(+)
MLVGSIGIAPERDKLPMMLLVAVRIQNSPVSDEVKRIVDHVVQDEAGDEGQGSVEDVEVTTPVGHSAAQKECSDVVHSQKLDHCVQGEVAQVVELQYLEFGHLLVSLVHARVAYQRVTSGLQDHVQQLLGWYRGGIEADVHGEVVEHTCRVECPWKGGASCCWRTYGRVCRNAGNNCDGEARPSGVDVGGLRALHRLSAG